MKEKRYQECNVIQKIWRLRWYIPIPFLWFWYMTIKPFKVLETNFDEDSGCVVDTEKYYTIRGKDLWSLLKGSAQTKMKWFYTMEEVFGDIKNKFKK